MPSNIKTVDADLLNGALEATANEIRAKTGGSGLIPFDYDGGTGFADAVRGIVSSGRCPRSVGSNVSQYGFFNYDNAVITA